LEPLLAKLIDKTEIARIEPLLCSVAEACVITGRSKRFIADGIVFWGTKRSTMDVRSGTRRYNGAYSSK
jgi:hypothetical protein